MIVKRTKEFFGVLINVLVCVFIVSLGVYAATTIGLDITIDDDLIITGNNIDFDNGASISNSGNADLLVFTATQIDIVGYATVSQDFQVEGNLDAMGVASVAGKTYLYDTLEFSDGGTIDNSGATTLQLTEDNIDLVGMLAIDHTSISEELQWGTGPALFGGIASPSGDCRQGSWYFRAGETASTSIYFCETEDEWDQVIGLDLGD